MKKLITLFITLICLNFTISAQRVEIFGGFSYGSVVGSTPSFALPFNTVFYSPTYPAPREGGRSAMTLGVNVRILGNLSIGLSWTGINKGSQRFALLNVDNFNSVNFSTNTILFNVKYNWLKFWKIELYSRLGIGATFFGNPEFDITRPEDYEWGNDKPKSCKRLGWQASFVGVEYRPIKWVGIFAEGGLGRQGALLAGLKVFI